MKNKEEINLSDIKMKTEFDVEKVYPHIMTKEKLIGFIKRTYDKKFVVVFLPRTKSNSDILIRSMEKELNNSLKMR